MNKVARRPAGWRRAARISLISVIILSALTAVAGASGTLPGLPALAARADEVTGSQNNLRDGWDAAETGLSPATVGGGTFGQLFSTPVDGQVYAQPVVAGATVIVATETNAVYGLNAVSGAVQWSDSLGPPEPSSAQNGCTNLTPDIGITGTPVYDPGTGTVYLVAVENDGPGVSQPHVYMYALDAQTGKVSWRVPIQGAPVNDPTRPFNPLTERERPALLLLDGWVYAAFASYCDYGPYVGDVAGVSTTSRALTLWTDEAGLTDTQGGIWQSGGGLMSDGSGRIFLASGNGVSPAPGGGASPPGELGDAVVRLAVGSDGTLSAADFFSPANAPALDADDGDFGSGSPVGLPFGTSTYPDLLVQAGKDGRIFLLNRDGLGGREQGPGGTDADLSKTGPFKGQWGHPAVFGPDATVSPGGSGDYVYYVGNTDVMRFLRFGVNGSGIPALTDVATSTTTFGYSSGSPVVTSDGNDPSSAVVWEVDSSSTGAGATLQAFDAVPPASCTGTAPCRMMPIWTAPIGTASEFTVPATDNGIVYVGTRDGHVLAFGSPDRAPLTGPPLNFGQVAVGSTVTRPVTVTAAGNVTVSAVTTSGGSFTAGSVTLPVTLSAGQTLTVPVTFSPAGPGGATGSLDLATNSANFPAVSVSLTGDGTEPGLNATPSAVTFDSQPDGTSAAPVLVNITNGGTTSETVTATSPAAAPFSVTGLPAAGTVIQPGASVTVTVAFKPSAPGAATGSFAVTWSAGTLTVPLTGTGTADVSSLTAAPAAVSFGSVPLGQQATSDIQISNAGNLPATVTGSVPPAVPFGAPDPIAAGLPVNPGYDLEVPVTFTPASTGPAADSLAVTWTDVTGTHTLRVPVTGTGTPPAAGIAVPPPGGGWTLNGSARMAGTALVLTRPVKNQAGSAVYSVPVPTNGLTAQFTAQIGSGTGANGMTLSLLDATRSGPAALGADGSGLGFGGLPGIAIALGTYKSAGAPSANFVGIATGASGGGLHYAATATNVPDLRTGRHTVSVAIAGQRVTVSVDGHQVLSPTLAAGTVPSSALVAFTAGTGALDDSHVVTTARITSGGSVLPRPGGGWSYNAAAGMSGPDTVLTPARTDQAGSVIYPVPVRTSGLQVQFDAQLSGGTGADGLTFALLSPATRATSVGGDGAEAGFGGLTGVAVVLDTHKVPGYRSGNFAGLSTKVTAGHLDISAVALAIPQLRSGTHTILVQVIAGTPAPVLVVWLDGEQILASPEATLRSTALLAFTGGTGGLTDVHTVRDVAISAPSG